MLEILLLIMMSKKLGVRVAEKGHSKFPYQLLLWGLWFGGEIGGALFGGLTASFFARGEEAPMLYIYLCALVGAGIGAVIAHAIANGLKPVPRDEVRPMHYPKDADRRFGDRDQGREEITDRPAPYTDERYS